jgi:hypothetical protein
MGEIELRGREQPVGVAKWPDCRFVAPKRHPARLNCSIKDASRRLSNSSFPTVHGLVNKFPQSGWRLSLASQA